MQKRPRPARRLVSLPALLLLVAACDLAYPEIVVVNRTATTVLLKDLSFSGCAWSSTLGFGEATAPSRCLPGQDRVHFQKLDLAGVRPSQRGRSDLVSVPDDRAEEVAYGDFQRLEIELDDLEQDFSVPGPYGH